MCRSRRRTGKSGGGRALNARQPVHGHTLAEALEQAAILSHVQPEIAVVDRGYKGVAIDGVRSITWVCDAASCAACGNDPAAKRD